MTGPIAFEWIGDAMVPLKRFHNVCNATFIVGQRYMLEELQDRSSASHRHYFACIHEAWTNLSEEYADQFPTSDHLRKWALIKAGYRDERTLVCASKAEALRVSAFIKPMDDYAVVVVRDAVVAVYTAKSQSTRAMGKADFQASKDAVLRIVADLVRVSPSEIEKNAKEVA